MQGEDGASRAVMQGNDGDGASKAVMQGNDGDGASRAVMQGNKPPREPLAASARALLMKLQGGREAGGEGSESGAEEKDEDEVDGLEEGAGSSGEDSAGSPEEVVYSDNTSFESGDESDASDRADVGEEHVSVRACGDCGEERDRGRVDEADMIWYCDDCWASYETASDREARDDASAQGASGYAASQYSSDGQDAGTCGSLRSVDGDDDNVADDVEGDVEGENVQAPARPAHRSACCSACGVSEAGGHVTAEGEHYCDFCWDEGLGSAGGNQSRRSPPGELPIEEFRDEIISSIRNNTVTSIQGETGCGKSSMVPHFILEDCQASRQRVNIFVTQPRRIAAITLARRVADQRREAVGRTVGYRVGNGDHQESRNTKIVFCTVGYLLAFLSHNPEYFSRITHLVLDEVHERSVDADSLNFLVKNMMESHPIKLVVMSATLQTDTFGHYFTPRSEIVQDPIFVGARRFEVQRLFLDSLSAELPDVDEGLVRKMMAKFCSNNVAAKMSSEAKELIVQCIEALAVTGSAMLVFLPGMDEICEVQEEIDQRALLNMSVHVLHSQVPQEDQDRSLAPPDAGMSKVILTTNIAESSITVPDVETVIDTGLVRGMFFDDQRRMSCLLSKWCSRASLRQRAGRAGRVKEGTVIHLMTEAFHDRLGEFDEAEILRTPLTKTVLNVKILFRRFGSPSDVLSKFVAPPPPIRVRVAVEELYQAGATTTSTEDAEVTALGEAATKLPVDLPLCKLILLGTAMAVSNSAIVMAAALSLQDVFALPMALFIPDAKDFAQELAANFSARFRFDQGQYSEPLMYLRLFESWLASNRDAAWCRQNKLSMPRMRQLDGMVATLAAGSKHLLSQHNLIPDLVDKLEIAARNRTRITEKEAEIICRQGSDLNVHRFILAGALSPVFLVGEASTGIEREVLRRKMDPRKTVVVSDVTPKETSPKDVVSALQGLLQAAGRGCGQVLPDQIPGQRIILAKKSSDQAARARASKHGGAMKIANSEQLSSGQLLIELNGPETSVPPEGAHRGCRAVAEDVTHPVKVLLQLYKQNRGKLQIPNPKFTVGGDQPEHIRIGKIMASCTLAWKLGLNTKALPSSRQPVCHMSDFSEYGSQRLAVAFSLVGSDSPKSVNADGMSVLPAGFGDFLCLTFAQRHSEVRVLCRRNEEMLTLEAALCQNMALELHGAFNMEVVNFFRRDIVSKAMAGQLVSAQDRRRGKQLLAEIVQFFDAPSPCASSVATEWVWMTCDHVHDSDDYFPEWHLQPAASHSEWPALGPDLGPSARASIQPRRPQSAKSSKEKKSEARLVQVIENIMAPVLNQRRMVLLDLNAMLQASPAVMRAAMQCPQHGGKSEICILGTYVDRHPCSLLYKHQISSEGRQRIVAAKPEFEEKTRESEICRHTECERDAQHGPQNGFDGDSIEPLPVGREIFNALGICIGFACCEDEGAGNDAAGAAESQLKQENAGSAKTRSSASSPGLEGGAPEYTRGDEDSASMLMRDRHSASMSDTGDVPVGPEGDLSASSPAIDAHLRCQLESAITMLGLSSEQPHAALSTAGMNGLLGKVTDQGGGVEESTNRLAGRLRTLENALRNMLHSNGMTLDEVNREVSQDADLSRLTQELFCEYEARNEAKMRSSARGIRENVRENPLRENGALKAIFFKNRKALFCWHPSGSKWKRTTQPKNGHGRILTNSNLSNALSERTAPEAQVQQPRHEAEFTKEEWVAFGISDLRMDDYIRCGNAYFKPADNPSDVLFSAKRGEQEQCEKEMNSVMPMATSRSHQIEPGAEPGAIPKAAGPGSRMKSRATLQPSCTQQTKDTVEAGMLHCGVQLEKGWQEWKAPDGRNYYFHPDSQVSQWEVPEGVKKGLGMLKQQAPGPENESSKTKNDAMRALESELVTMLRGKELDLDQVNQKLQDKSRTRGVLEKLSKYAKESRARDLGLEKDGTVKRDFFDARPHLFKTRSKGRRTFVSA